MMEKTLPMIVRLFQFCASEEETVIRVPESAGNSRKEIVFLAVRGDTPQIEPWLTEMEFEDASAATVQPFWSSIAFNST